MENQQSINYKFVIKARAKSEEDIYCNSFGDLTSPQKQDIANRYISNHHFRLQNSVVEYILRQGYEDSEAPFSWEDVTNNDRYGQIEIGGYWEEVTEEERDELIEKFDHLVDRWYDYKEDVLQERIDTLEADQLDIDEEEDQEAFDKIQAKIDSLQARFDKANDKHTELDSTLDNLRALECDEEHEIYQWFEVDRDTAHRLEEQGESILDGDYWGRGTCGQSITLDHCIQTIAFNHLSTRL